MGQPIYLTTKRLIIRDHLIEDFETHHDLFSNERVMYYLESIKTNSKLESRDNLIESIHEISSDSRKKYYFRIEDKYTNKHIGEIGYTVMHTTPIGKLVDLGYFIYPEYWGNGYVTEATNEVIDYALKKGGVYRISAGCLKENIGSERVMQKCGMYKEAELKSVSWFDNQLRDRVV